MELLRERERERERESTVTFFRTIKSYLKKPSCRSLLTDIAIQQRKANNDLMEAVIASRKNRISPFITKISIADFEFRIKTHDPEIDKIISYLIFIENNYEEFETNLFIEFCKNKSIVYDIGANIGWHTLVACSANPLNKVISFEPEAKNFAILKQNILLNSFSDRVNIINQAVSDKSGEALLYLDENNFGDHRVSYDEVDREIMNISTTTLHNFMQNQTNLPDIIKIDTQGFEALVLKTLWDLLSNDFNPTFFLEFWPYQIQKNGENPFDLLAKFEEKRYKIFVINLHNKCLEEFNYNLFNQYKDLFFSNNSYAYLNLLCVHLNNDVAIKKTSLYHVKVFSGQVN